MKPIVNSVISGLASMGVSTVVVNVVKNNTPRNLNLYHKLMVGLGTFVLSSVLADICAEKLVEMIDENMPVKPKRKIDQDTDKIPASEDPYPDVPLCDHTVSNSERVMGVILIQRYLDSFMVTDNPIIPDSMVLEGLVCEFCGENKLNRDAYKLTFRFPLDMSSRPGESLISVSLHTPLSAEEINGP